MAAHSPIRQYVDRAERDGKLNFRFAEVTSTHPEQSESALRQALHRLQKKGRIVLASRGSDHWIIVPFQDAHAGAPPLESWLHTYMAKTLQVPYYVGLLSAAEVYGASPYAVMVTQIVVAKPRRSLQIGPHKLVFTVRSNVAEAPAQWHENSAGRFKVSTPEMTALDLIQHQADVGGLGRLFAVLHRLFDTCSSANLQHALDIVDTTPLAQRLGALLGLDGRDELTNEVDRWLAGRRMRPVNLGEPSSGQKETYFFDSNFKVRLPRDLDTANA